MIELRDELFAATERKKKMENEKLAKLYAMHDRFVAYAPDGAALLDIIERPDEWIVIYRDSETYAYAIGHLTDSGLYYRRYDSSYDAWTAFDDMRQEEEIRRMADGCL